MLPDAREVDVVINTDTMVWAQTGSVEGTVVLMPMNGPELTLKDSLGRLFQPAAAEKQE